AGQILRHVARQQTRPAVVKTAGGKADDHRDRLALIEGFLLSAKRRCDRRQPDRYAQRTNDFHASSVRVEDCPPVSAAATSRHESALRCFGLPSQRMPKIR